MYMSESIINNLLLEIDTLSCRLSNIKETYKNTEHNGLRVRLIDENHNIFRRIYEIFSIAKLLNKRTKEKLSFSRLLVEKCTRTIAETKITNEICENKCFFFNHSY